MVSDTLDDAPLATHEGVRILGGLRLIGEGIHAHLQIKLLLVGKLSTKREQHEPSPDRLSQIPTVVRRLRRPSGREPRCARR